MVSGLWADGVKTPEDIGKQAFVILKNLDNEDFQSFRAKLAAKEEILAFAKESIKDQESLKEMEQMLNDSFETETKENFDGLKADYFGKILWNNIVFKDFIFESIDDSRFKKNKAYNGKFYFSADDKNFRVRIAFFLLDNTYHIIMINELLPADDEAVKQQ